MICMNKRKKFLLWIILFFTILLLCFVMCVPQTSSGGGGSSDNEDTSKYYYTEDTINWNKMFDGNGGGDIANSVAVDLNNNVYVVGYGSNLISGSSNHDWWIKKFDSNGNADTTNWNKMFDGNGSSDCARSVAIDSNNNIYVVGYGYNLVTGSSSFDWWIKKFNSKGNIIWNKIYDGNGSDDYAYSVAIDSFNNIYIVGSGVNLVTGSSGFDWWIKKFDSNGNEDTINWNKMFNGNVGSFEEMAYSVAIDSNNNVYVAGYGISLISVSSGFDWWIKKFDSNGNEDTTNWDLKFDGNGGNDYARSVAIDSNNNVYVVGYGYNLISGSSGSDWWIKKFDSNGNEDITNWNKIYNGNGGKDQANSVLIDLNNNVYVAGCGEDLFSNNSTYDWWIKKFDSNGNEDITNWNKIYNGNGSSDETYSISIDLNDNVYIVGYGSNLISSSSISDWWIKKFLKIDL